MVSDGPSSRGFAFRYVLPPPPFSSAQRIRDPQVYMYKVFTKFHTTILGKYSLSE